MSINIKLIIALIVVSFTSCNSQEKNKDNSQNKTMKKFEWRPTANAPKYYPAEIISGNFYMEDNSSIYIPKGHTLMSGWGKTGATHVVGEDFKAIPNKFDIKWVSYLEEKFYGGSFTLPKDKITNLFEEGFIGLLGKKTTYTNILIGLAPGGIIVVWLYGDKTVEIGRFKASEIEITKEEFIPNAVLSVEQFIKETKEGILKDDIQGAVNPENIPFGLWDSYRSTYNWKPIFKLKNKGVFTKIYIDYINGEHIYTIAKNEEIKDYQLKALPERITLYWEDENKNVFGSKLYFDEAEVKTAFKTTDSASKTKEIDMLFEVDKYNGTMEITLKSDTESIKLEKTRIKIFETTK